MLPLRRVLSLYEIAQEARAEAGTRAGELEAVFAAISDAVLVYNADGTLRQANPAAQKLAPVAPPPIPTSADKLPLTQLHAPKDFKIELYASGLTNARSLRVGASKQEPLVNLAKLHLLVDLCGGGMADFSHRNAILQFGELSRPPRLKRRRESPEFHPPWVTTLRSS